MVLAGIALAATGAHAQTTVLDNSPATGRPAIGAACSRQFPCEDGREPSYTVRDFNALHEGLTLTADVFPGSGTRRGPCEGCTDGMVDPDGFALDPEVSYRWIRMVPRLTPREAANLPRRYHWTHPLARFDPDAAAALEWADSPRAFVREVPIPGATGRTYTLQAADAGYWIKVEATVTDRLGGKTTRESTVQPAATWPGVYATGGEGPTGVCRRTPAVRDAIMRSLPALQHCREVRPRHLAGLTELDYLPGKFSVETASLKPGDFDGLSALTKLGVTLKEPTIRSVAPGTFRGLDRLEELNLWGDGKDGGITALGDGAFAGMPALEFVNIFNHKNLASLGSGLFRHRRLVEEVWLSSLPALSALPAGLLHGLAKLYGVRMNNLNTLTAIPAGFFRDNPGLGQVWLARNSALATVPGDLFANSPRVTFLWLSSTVLTASAFQNGFFEPLRALDLLELPGTHTALSADTAMDADIDPQDVTGTVETVIALDGNPQSTTPWGTNLLWEWTQVASCAANAAEVTTGAVTLTGADTATPSFTAPSSTTTLYFRATAKPPGGRSDPDDIPYDFSDTGCATVTVQAAMSQVAAPSVSSVSLSAPPGDDNGWDPGDAVEAVLTFDEAVTVDTTNGTPGVTVKLGENQTEKTAAYASGSATTELTFRYTLATNEGPYTEALLDANSLALNGGAIRSTATQADASLAHNGTAQIYLRSIVPEEDDGPTATFSNVPATHDGESAFEVGLAFSAQSSITSYVTVRDSLLEVAGATVTGARRKVRGSDVAWVLTVQPSGPGDVMLTLPVRACTETNAVCIGGKPVVRAATATVEGPPFTASFDGTPAEHDGTDFLVHFKMSLPPQSLSYVTVRDSLFAVSGGSIPRVRRLARGANRDWELTVNPDGYGPVTLALNPTTDCATRPGICDAAGRKLAGPLSLTVEGPPTLSVADAAVDEAQDATLAFTVTLSRALDSPVTVQYATSDGTATAGSDYTAASGTLTFAAGDTTKTVSVAVLDDAHDEGDETLTLTLSNPSPARVKLEAVVKGVTGVSRTPRPRG